MRVVSFLLRLLIFFHTVFLPLPQIFAVPGCSIFFQPDFKWKKAICDSVTKRLTEIPAGLPVNLINLLIMHQHLPSLSSNGLTQLVNLEILHIESSSLSRIAVDAFHALHGLKELNLRNNSLQLGYAGLPREALQYLPNLQVLNLAENPIDFIPDAFFALAGGSSLRNLYLSGTKSALMRVDPQAFRGLIRLEVLDMSFSRLATLPFQLEDAFSLMVDLHELYMDGNPWHCDCHLRWLRRWYYQLVEPRLKYARKSVDSLGNTVLSEPMCFSPFDVKEHLIFGERTRNSDFKCAPKMITGDQNVTVSSGQPVSLTCEFYADPPLTVLWYKDGQMVRNTSHLSISQRSTGDTYVTTLQAEMDEISGSGEWTCLLKDLSLELSATFHVSVLSGGQFLLAGMTVTQQGWIYASVGVGILFIILTAIGFGIFYFCDPRSQTDQTMQRWVGKGQAGRLQGCYGCSKAVPGRSHSQYVSSECENEALKCKIDYTLDRIDGMTNATQEKQKSLRNNHSPIKSSFADSPILNQTNISTVIKLQRTANHLNILGGSLIRETVNTGENRLLVSCDGPEPTVLLATRLAANGDIESPASVYGIPDPSEYGLSPVHGINGARGNPIPMMDYLTSTSNLPGSLSIQSPHIYARVTPAVVNFNKGDDSSITTSREPNGRFTAPCPVHGSLPLDRVQTSSDNQYSGSMQDNKINSPIHLHRKNESTDRQSGSVCSNSQSTSGLWYPRYNEVTSVLAGQHKQNTKDSAHVDSNMFNSNNFQNVKYPSQPYPSIRSPPQNASNLHSDHHALLNCYNANRSKSILQTYPDLDSDSTRFDDWTKNSNTLSSKNKMMPSYIKRSENEERLVRQLQRQLTNKNRSRSSSTTSLSESSAIASSNSSPRSSSPHRHPGPPPQVFDHKQIPFFKSRMNNGGSVYANRRYTWRAAPRPVWTSGGGWQFGAWHTGSDPHSLSPGSGSVQSATFRATTLPSRFRKPDLNTHSHAYVTRSIRDLRASQFGYNIVSTNPTQSYTPSTFVRPGSKHKLDTDSGTDYND